MVTVFQLCHLEHLHSQHYVRDREEQTSQERRRLPCSKGQCCHQANQSNVDTHSGSHYSWVRCFLQVWIQVDVETDSHCEQDQIHKADPGGGGGGVCCIARGDEGDWVHQMSQSKCTHSWKGYEIHNANKFQEKYSFINRRGKNLKHPLHVSYVYVIPTCASRLQTRLSYRGEKVRAISGSSRQQQRRPNLRQHPRSSSPRSSSARLQPAGA